MNQVIHNLNAVAALTVAVWFALTVGGVTVAQQSPEQHAQHRPTAADPQNMDLSAELESLRGKVLALEAALAKQHQSRYGTAPAMQQGSMTKQPMPDASGSSQGPMKMGGMKRMNSNADSDGSMSKGMGMTGGGMKGMGGMSDGSGGMGMGMMSGKMGMMGRNPAMKSSMGGMSSMSGMSMQSALPGFPGASHLYHIGETGFFLDHPQHITLTDDQQLQLNKVKEAALLATATAERKIDEAEQQLWILTAEAEPDIKKIEAKAKEIAQLTVDSRIAFIRSVGEAAGLLTQEQRQTLVGMATPSGADTGH